MSLASRRHGAPTALLIPAGSATLPCRRLSSACITPNLSTYGLSPSSLFPQPTTPEETEEDEPVENHEKPHPRILVGREQDWAHFYGSSLWSVHLLDHVEQIFPLQPLIALTPKHKVLRGWEAHIGAFDISHPARATGAWLLPHAAHAWWAEDYATQLDRVFPREDIVFLLHRAEDILASLKAGEDELAALKESLYWLTAERTPSACSSASSRSSRLTRPRTPLDAYTRSVLRTHRSRISELRRTLSAVHRLPAILVVIRALLQYLRARARAECAAIARRERARTDTPRDAGVVERVEAMACWHVAPEVRLEALMALAEEWFARGERGMRDLGRWSDLVEGRLR